MCTVTAYPTWTGAWLCPPQVEVSTLVKASAHPTLYPFYHGQGAQCSCSPALAMTALDLTLWNHCG